MIKNGRPKIQLDIVLLSKLLANKYIPITDIAKRMDVTRNTIYNRINEFEILREQALIGNRKIREKENATK